MHHNYNSNERNYNNIVIKEKLNNDDNDDNDESFVRGNLWMQGISTQNP